MRESKMSLKTPDGLASELVRMFLIEQSHITGLSRFMEGYLVHEPHMETLKAVVNAQLVNARLVNAKLVRARLVNAPGVPQHRIDQLVNVIASYVKIKIKIKVGDKVQVTGYDKGTYLTKKGDLHIDYCGLKGEVVGVVRDPEHIGYRDVRVKFNDPVTFYFENGAEITVLGSTFKHDNLEVC